MQVRALYLLSLHNMCMAWHVHGWLHSATADVKQ
jgi:hypothetical protein